MKQMKIMLVSVLAVLTMGMAVAQNVTPISDFAYELTKDGMGILLTKYKGTATEIVMPSEIEGIPVTELDYNDGRHFPGFEKVVSVILPSNVTILPRYFFYKCSCLKKVTLPDNLEKIDVRAFGKCSALESIEIPNSVVRIEVSAFEYCASLKNVTLSQKLKEIESSAFSDCVKLESITIPDTVEYIGQAAFCRCTALESVNLPMNCGIGESAFKNCKKLKNIIIPDSLSGNPGRDSFSGCESLPISIQVKLRQLGYKDGF